jgi:hypothetical protein
VGAAGILRGVIAIKFGSLLQLGDAGGGLMPAAAWRQESPQASESYSDPPHIAPSWRKDTGSQAAGDLPGTGCRCAPRLDDSLRRSQSNLVDLCGASWTIKWQEESCNGIAHR